MNKAQELNTVIDTIVSINNQKDQEIRYLKERVKGLETYTNMLEKQISILTKQLEREVGLF